MKKKKERNKTLHIDTAWKKMRGILFWVEMIKNFNIKYLNENISFHTDKDFCRR